MVATGGEVPWEAGGGRTSDGVATGERMRVVAEGAVHGAACSGERALAFGDPDVAMNCQLIDVIVWSVAGVSPRSGA